MSCRREGRERGKLVNSVKGAEVSDEDYLLRSEYRRVNHHERMPCRAREKAPKLCGLFQYERPVRRDSRADTPRFVWFQS